MTVDGAIKETYKYYSHMFEVYGLTGMKVDKANLKKKEGGDEAAGEDGGDIDI